MKYFIANWKAYKNLQETLEWIDIFTEKLETDQAVRSKLQNNNTHVIICPPSPLLFLFSDLIKRYPNISLGAQDISAYDEGSYTGETTGKSLRGVVSHVIIGHSERKRYFNETAEIIQKKTTQALANTIAPLVCFEKPQELLPNNADFFAYEPPSAIGTGKNESLQNVLEIKKLLTFKKQYLFIYGGSITEKTIHEYLQSDEINGFLIGGASLDPVHFYTIIAQQQT